MAYSASCEENDAFRLSLYSMRESALFCDATIHIPEETKTLPVHRAILSSCSPFFRSLFTGDFKEAKQHDITIHGASFEMMELLIRYAYTNKVPIDFDNVEKIFAAADRFNVLGLLNECIKVLGAETCAENCIGVLRFAKTYNNRELTDTTWNYITKHFQELVNESEEIYSLEIDELVEILRSDQLNVDSEDEVFEFVIKWVESHPIGERKSYLNDLLATVRFPYCSEEYLQKQMSGRRDLKRGPYWERIALSHNFIKRCRSSKKSAVRSKARKVAKWISPRIPNNVVFVIGGWGRHGVTDIVETYDRHMDQWFQVGECELPNPRAYHSTATLDGKLYVIGGFSGIGYLNSVICFDVEKKQWNEKAPMYMPRCYVSVCELNGIIYAIGGYDGTRRHQSGEKYDCIRNQWTLIAPMFFPRSDAGAASFRGNIYVAGGFDGVACLVSTEMYDPGSDQWTMLAPMSSRRSGICMATCNDRVYAIGGYDGGRRLRSMECLDSRGRHWCSAPRMIVGRSNFSCTVIDDVIYAIGGYDGDTTTAKVERYLPLKQKWELLNEMNNGRSAVSSCVAANVNNVSDFTFHGNWKLPLPDDVKAKPKQEFSCSGDNTNPHGEDSDMADEQALELVLAMCI